MRLSKKLKLFHHKYNWRRFNKHNYSYAINDFDISKVSVGKYTYGGIEAYFYGKCNEFLKIGNFCSIAGGVKFVCGGEHEYSSLMTFPLSTYFSNANVSFSKGPIIIDDDVWIGTNALILSGVHIGQGAIISFKFIPFPLPTLKVPLISEKTIFKIIKIASVINI